MRNGHLGLFDQELNPPDLRFVLSSSNFTWLGLFSLKHQTIIIHTSQLIYMEPILNHIISRYFTEIIESDHLVIEHLKGFYMLFSVSSQKNILTGQKSPVWLLRSKNAKFKRLATKRLIRGRTRLTLEHMVEAAPCSGVILVQIKEETAKHSSHVGGAQIGADAPPYWEEAAKMVWPSISDDPWIPPWCSRHVPLESGPEHDYASKLALETSREASQRACWERCITTPPQITQKMRNIVEMAHIIKL